MRVVLMRHGPAGDPDPQRWPDDRLRPLTPRGEIGHPPENEPRTEWHPDPGILSAKELAQAFQLDFNPEMQVPPRHRLLRGSLTALVLAIVGLSGLLLLLPDLRGPAWTWAGGVGDSVQRFFSRSSKSAKPADANAVSPTQTAQNALAPETVKYRQPPKAFFECRQQRPISSY